MAGKNVANWKIKPEKDFSSIKDLGVSKTLLKILSSRGFDEIESVKNFLYADYETGIHDPFLFSDMEKIIKRIQKAVDEKEKIAIFGDYDADGVTSSVILKQTFEELGLSAEVYIPDKMIEGYGFNMSAMEQLGEKGVKLVISVDCGITGIKEVEKANELGMDVIITDHHHVPEELPNAFAIINPKMKESRYPFTELAGVGVAFKLAQAIYDRLLTDKKEQIKWMLDLVAIGTVADCVPLVGENRIFVKYGLIVLSKTKRAGLLQLFSVARLNIDENNIPSTRNIAFHIAPRINAAGRVNHANLAFDLLVENDMSHARLLALELEDNNSNRQKMTDVVVNEVRALAEGMFKDKKIIFAVGENFPIGIVGLVAGKIAQQFNKPTAVIQKGEIESKGSFRSIPQVNIIEVIEKCSDSLLKFGGHSQAAGISIENSKLEEFMDKLEGEVEKILAGKDMSPELEIDALIEPGDADFSLAEELDKMKPFGEGNSEPLLVMKDLRVEDVRILGNGEKHIKFFLRRERGGETFGAIAFYMAKDLLHIEKGDNVDIAFNLQKDEWNGNRKIQLIISDIKKSGCTS